MFTSLLRKPEVKKLDDSWSWDDFDRHNNGISENSIGSRLRKLGLTFHEARYAFDNAKQKLVREEIRAKHPDIAEDERENLFSFSREMKFLEALLKSGFTTSDALMWSRVALMAGLPVSVAVSTAEKREVDPELLLGLMEHNAVAHGGVLDFAPLYHSAVSGIDSSMMMDLSGINPSASVYRVLVLDFFGAITVDIEDSNNVYASRESFDAVEEDDWLSNSTVDGLDFFQQITLNEPFDPRAAAIRDFCIAIISKKTGKSAVDIKLNATYCWDES